MTPANPLRVAIDDLYAAFADVPAPTGLDHCDHCLLPEEVDALLAWPDVRTIPADLVRLYAVNWFAGTAGSQDDAHYFAPRLLDAALDPGADLEFETVCRFLAHSATGWPRSQRDALDGFGRAVWLDRLMSHPHRLGHLAHDVLPAVSLLTDVTSLLDLWTDVVAEPHPAAHLQELLFWGWFEPEVAVWVRGDRLLDAVGATGDDLLLQALLEERSRQG